MVKLKLSSLILKYIILKLSIQILEWWERRKGLTFAFSCHLKEEVTRAGGGAWVAQAVRCLLRSQFRGSGTEPHVGLPAQ